MQAIISIILAITIAISGCISAGPEKIADNKSALDLSDEDLIKEAIIGKNITYRCWTDQTYTITEKDAKNIVKTNRYWIVQTELFEIKVANNGEIVEVSEKFMC